MGGPRKAYRAIITTANQSPGIVQDLQRFRKRIFVDEHGWQLRCEADGREVDEFDTAQAVHVALSDGRGLVGTFRALRADGPYLVQSKFPQLARSRPFPFGRDVWEISRFAVDPRAGHAAAPANYAVMFRFAHLRQARALIALADLRYERFLSHLGVVSRRYGVPERIGTDQHGRPVIGLAGEIPITEQGGHRFERLLQQNQHVEIIDETLVLGCERLSA